MRRFVDLARKNVGRFSAPNKRMVSSITQGITESEIMVIDIPDDKDKDANGIVFDQATGSVDGFCVDSAKAETVEQFRKLHAARQLRNSISIGKVLESFDSKTWSSFVAKYLNPVITNILPIEQERELVTSYKYCIPPASFVATPTVTRERAMRNLAKALHFFPMITGSILEYDQKNGLEILHEVIPGVSSKPGEKFLRYLNIPDATPGFIRKISSAKHHFLIKYLYDYVHDGIDLKSAAGRKLLNNTIAALPPAWDKKQAEAMWDVVNSLKSSSLQKKVQRKLFSNIQSGDWDNNRHVLKKEFGTSLRNYLSSIALFLILPEYIKKFDEKIEKDNATKSLFGKKKSSFPKSYNHWFVQHVVDELVVFLEDKLLSQSTPKKINDRIKEFDKRTPAIDANRPIFLKRREEFKRNNYQSYPEWYKLFDDCEIEGFKFRSLCSEAELAQEADEIGHCGGGYGQRCRNGIRHIVSVTAPDGERVTLRLDSRPPNMFGEYTISLGEIVTAKIDGINRQDISPKMNQMVNNFVRNISEYKIQTSRVVGAIDRNYSISDMAGVELDDIESREGIFSVFRDSDVIKTTARTLDEFLREIDLDGYLSEVLPKHAALSANNSPTPEIEAKIAERLKDKGAREFIGGMDN